MTAPAADACDACLRRTALIAWLSGHIENEWRLRRGRPQLLALPDAELLAWAGLGEVDEWYRTFDATAARAAIAAAGLGAACRCSDTYPQGLHELPDPPAVLHTRGDAALLSEDGVALVGARAALPYGLEVARVLGRGLAAAGVTVVSGMALGIDSAAHRGALEAGRTLAVLATGADRPYPARAAGLHARIAATGCVVSELPPGTPPRRWAFPARNRLIAALSAGSVVIEGGQRSGSLITADFAAELGRFVAAVPGPITSPMSTGPHALLKAGAEIVRSAEDVLDLLHGVPAPTGATVIGAGPRARPAPAAPPPDLPAELHAVLTAIDRGAGSLAELVSDPADGLRVATALGELEVRGLVRRVFGGRYIRAVA